jgi:hypothetical protein
LKKITKSFKKKQKTMLKDDIRKDHKIKKISTLINFSNSWPGSSNWKQYTWKNYEAQSLENETLKDEIKKKSQKNLK